MRYACALALLSESWRDLIYCLRRTRERVRSLAMLSESPNTDAAPCLFITRPIVTRKLLGQCKPVAGSLAAILQCDARSLELIVANYIIRTPRPT